MIRFFFWIPQIMVCALLFSGSSCHRGGVKQHLTLATGPTSDRLEQDSSRPIQARLQERVLTPSQDFRFDGWMLPTAVSQEGGGLFIIGGGLENKLQVLRFDSKNQILSQREGERYYRVFRTYRRKEGGFWLFGIGSGGSEEEQKLVLDGYRQDGTFITRLDISKILQTLQGIFPETLSVAFSTLLNWQDERHLLVPLIEGDKLHVVRLKLEKDELTWDQSFGRNGVGTVKDSFLLPDVPEKIHTREIALQLLPGGDFLAILKEGDFSYEHNVRLCVLKFTKDGFLKQDEQPPLFGQQGRLEFSPSGSNQEVYSYSWANPISTDPISGDFVILRQVIKRSGTSPALNDFQYDAEVLRYHSTGKLDEFFGQRGLIRFPVVTKEEQNNYSEPVFSNGRLFLTATTGSKGGEQDGKIQTMLVCYEKDGSFCKGTDEKGRVPIKILGPFKDPYHQVLDDGQLVIFSLTEIREKHSLEKKPITISFVRIAL